MSDCETVLFDPFYPQEVIFGKSGPGIVPDRGHGPDSIKKIR